METEIKIKSEIAAFPKIWSLGSPEAEHVFKGIVEITEKIDGSQFSFGRTLEGNFVMRTKGQQIYPETVQKLFQLTVAFALSAADKIVPGQFVYGESVTSPRHNTLKYNRVPKGCFIIFGHKVDGSWESDHEQLCKLSDFLGCEAVPLLYKGEVKDKAQLDEILTKDSILGGEKIEGIVAKNYSQWAVSAYSRECFAKLVREGFKERNSESHPTQKNDLGEFFKQFQTEARWAKAVQHLNEAGALTHSPKDIGPLMKEIQTDLLREEEQFIREALFRMFWKQISGTASKGAPEWYKSKLAERAFEK